MAGWIEIFRSGNHTDSSGKKHTVSNEDLAKMVKAYNPQKHEAPVVIGHPEDNHPAYAWVEALRAAGGKLFYKEKDAVPEFNEMRRKKMFKKRSISIYPDGTLKHIGWLGAMPPAVKGLQDVGFSGADSCVTYEFSEGDGTMDELAKVKKQLANEKLAREKAEGTASSYKEKLDSQTVEFAEAANKNKRKEISDFVEQGIKDGKILPGWKEMGLVSFMENVCNCAQKDTVLEFAEGKSTSQVDTGQWFKKFIGSFSEHHLFEEMAKPKEEKGADSEFAEEEALGKEMAELVNP